MSGGQHGVRALLLCNPGRIEKVQDPPQIRIHHAHYLYAQWIREGKLKVNSDWNKDLKIKFTAQDPCNIVRKTSGQQMADDMRFVIKTIVGKKTSSTRCPTGSTITAAAAAAARCRPGFTEQRRAYGKVKFDQIAGHRRDLCFCPLPQLPRPDRRYRRPLWRPLQRGAHLDHHVPGHGRAGRKRAHLPGDDLKDVGL
jgi:hypothetical protein